MANQKISDEDRILNDTFSLVYEELRRLASAIRRNESNLTIKSTALVDEAWIKLKNSPHLAATTPAHFKAIAAHAMRQVLVEEARRKGSRKRGGSGEAFFVSVDDLGDISFSTEIELLDLDAALKELKEMSTRQAQIVENRFFGGMSVTETAHELNISESAVERDWRVAKAWLATRIRPQSV